MIEQAVPMTFVEAVHTRRSVRRFTPETVPREDVRCMVELATRAASAGNAQMWRFVAVDDRATIIAMRDAVDAKLREVAAWPEVADRQAEARGLRGHALFFEHAPLVVAVFGLPYVSALDELLALHGVSREEQDRLRQRPDLLSIGAAVQLLVTSAHTMGYGSCWMSAPVVAAHAIEEILAVQPPAHLVGLVPIGRPAVNARISKRLPVDDVLSFR